MEVERVSVHLNVAAVPDSKDWRSHLEKLKSNHKVVSDEVTQIREHLSKMITEITNTLEKVDTREKFLNSSLESLVTTLIKNVNVP
jgi:estrogen-related receptor beta like 1